MLGSHTEYVTFLSTLLDRFDSIERVDFNAFLTSATEGYSAGTIRFSDDTMLTFVEHVDFDAKELFKYGYVVYQSGEKLYYYDSQPHPHDPSLATTHPHHKHILPDLKHNRIPAPGLTFDRSNLEFLIREIEATLL